MTTKPYRIVATPYFKSSLQRLSIFLTRKYSKQFADSNHQTLHAKIKERLPTQPRLAPVSPRLVELGITDYRQWAIDEHNIIFYRIADQESTIYLLLAMDSRQHIEKLLYELVVLGQ